MAPFTIEDLDDLGIYNKKELDNIHKINKYLIVSFITISMLLLLREFINII